MIIFPRIAMRVAIWIFLLTAGLAVLQNIPAYAADKSEPRYLAFQLFTFSPRSEEQARAFPPVKNTIDENVRDIVTRIGTVGDKDRHLAFVVGPLTFDQTDEEIRNLIRESFDVALKQGVAVGFHIDDSMFWGRMSSLASIENIEWMDWDRTPNTGRKLVWSATPLKIAPQLCINSRQVLDTVRERALLIGREIAQGQALLHQQARDELFAGVIAGWETQIGRDFETNHALGYCALANRGFSAAHPPADMDKEREAITNEFIGHWARSLAEAGVSKDKIYSHIAFVPRSLFDFRTTHDPRGVSETYGEVTNFTPPSAAFGRDFRPGFSTYPGPDSFQTIYDAMSVEGNPAWASSEGTAIDPPLAESGGRGIDMESYLGSLYNHGAVLVNVFGWGVGPENFPFRKVTEGRESLMAYRKFLDGKILDVREQAVQQLPSPEFFKKVEKLQALLPVKIQEQRKKLLPLYQEFTKMTEASRFRDAEKIADEILQMIEN